MDLRNLPSRLHRNAAATLLLFLVCAFTSAPAFAADPAIPAGHLRVHYHRTDANYSGWTIYAFDGTTEDTGNYGGGPVQAAGTDAYGAYYDVGINAGTQEVGLILHNPSAPGGDVKDTPNNLFVDPATQGIEYWAYSGIGKLYNTAPNLANPNALLPGYARIHYFRPDGNYANWTTYAFGDTSEYTGDFNSGLTPVTAYDSYGAYFDIGLIPTPKDLGFIVHNVSTGVKDPGPDMHLNVATYNQAWVISGNATVFTTVPTPAQILSSLLNVQQAYWIDRSRVAIQSQYAGSGDTYAITYSLTGGLSVTPTGLSGGTSIPLTVGGTLTADELARYPQLSSYTVLQLPENTPLAAIQKALKGQLAFSALGTNNSVAYATGIQIAGVLDDLYYYPGKLGVVFRHREHEWRDWDDDDGGTVKLKVWAPTAQNVSLQIFNHETDATPAETVRMHEHNGVWVARGDRDWTDKYYLYSVQVWVPSDNAVDTNATSDPYSIDIALNGTKSRITDLDSWETKPLGWDFSFAPPLRSISDLSLYELHIRDFSVNDKTVPAAHRGFYTAFEDRDSDGMKHLRSLADHGLKAVHILPSFHLASVNEDKSKWIIPTGLAQYPPAGQQQQAAVAASQSSPAYNWGYDPVHYMTPAGNYAINPKNRVREYRGMVDGLHQAGLRVVQDVVFNHTNAAGEGPNSNLDEVVPGYYHRLDANGSLEQGSCCPDTASEHRMMEKLIIDTLVLNARDYKIDGFRFDILSFMFTYNVAHIQQALRALNYEHDGVDGSKIYLYGEGFNFGDTANNQIGPNASQVNLYGFGVGTFNDRIRDGIHGGSPFTDERVQGFATGLFSDSSDYTTSTLSPSQQQAQLLRYSDWIDVGLTGNLRDYKFVDSAGATVTGAQVDYNGQPTGYTKSPVEAVNYASVHDNQDLFDKVQLKSNLSDSIATRARRQIIAMSLVTLGQGVPFYQAGDDLLRSKDMDQNSYNSGDWFNKIDWSGRTANWGIGLPIASQNQNQWPIMTPLLNNAAYTPQPANIAYTEEAFRELLDIRYSSDLFRMGTLAEVQQNLTFLNTGQNQTPGVIVMKLDANGGHYGAYRHIVVVFNATNAQEVFTDARLKGLSLKLHPVQKNSSDPITKESTFDSKEGTATVPALTTAVFVAD